MAVGVVGREAEVTAAARFADVVRHGPAALLIAGEAGIGKTIIWREGVNAAVGSGCRVLSTRPVEAETKLSYLGLSDLLADVLDLSSIDLPFPQRNALEIALLRADGDTRVDHRALSMAALGVVRAVASSGPVVIAVDDAQWLDRPTARVLGFVIRRLRDEPVGVLATVRVQDDDIVPHWLIGALANERLRIMRVGALSVGALHHVLHQGLQSTFKRSVLVRLHRASAGNPFVALEMGRALMRRGGELRPGEALPVPDKIRDLVRERLAGLTARARKSLLAVAAMSQPTSELVRRAAYRQQFVDADLDEAVRAGIVELEGERIRFTHPLLASVPYSEASPGERRRLHQRLATVVAEPEEQARHMALGSSGPDADVAASLDAAAWQARRRGAPDAAAELSELARELTPMDHMDDALRRTVVTAEYRFAAGDVEGARDQLEAVLATTRQGPTRADVLRRLAMVRQWQEGFDAAATLLLEAEDQMGDDPWLTATIGEALSFVAVQRGDTALADERARAALALAEDLDDPGLLARTLTDVGFTGFLLGRGIESAVWERAMALEEFTDDDPPERRPSVQLAALLGWSGDLDGARERLDVAAQRCADRGDEQALPIISFYRVSLERFCGHWELAARIASDVLGEAEGLGSDALLAYVLSFKAMLDAGLGNIGSARTEGQQGLTLARSAGATPAVVFALSALGFAELSVGDPAAAHAFLGPLADAARATGIVEPTLYQFLPDEIEALVALGDLDQAEPHIAWLETQGRALDRPWALAAGGRGRGLLLAAQGDLAGAEAALADALVQNERLPVPFELARTLLCLGQVERRAKKKKAARGSLERALSIFERLPAPLWAEKARLEIARIGGRPPAPSWLTESESRVAELVSAGQTNKEVASALFMSVNTVEAHLKRIYRKLDVRSRTEMSHKMSDDTAPPVAPV